MKSIGGTQAVQRAFTISHTLDCRDKHDIVCRDAAIGKHEGIYTEASATLQHPHVIIEGRFFTRSLGTEVGNFTRWLDSDPRGASATHCNILVEDPFKRTGIARAHYSAALRYYREIGVKRVFLQANNMGPYVWSDFGFQYGDMEWRRMMTLLEGAFNVDYESEVPFWPSTSEELLLMTGPDGARVGYNLVNGVHAAWGALNMELDLTDSSIIALLKDEGLV